MRRCTLALFVLVLGACSTPKITVQRVADPRAPLGKNSRFRISEAPAPSGSIVLGRIAFETKPGDLHRAIIRMRRRALRLGGNRVARLRCVPAKSAARRKGFYLTKSQPLSAGQRIYCTGELHWDARLGR
jgi:hypothetical protein